MNEQQRILVWEIQVLVDSFCKQWQTIRTYALFPNGAPEEIEDKHDSVDELDQLRTLLTASPTMASVFPARLSNKE